MKRALVVSAGTVAGMAAVLTYSPAAPGVVDLSAQDQVHLVGSVTVDASPSAIPLSSASKLSVKRVVGKKKVTKHVSASPTPTPTPSSNASQSTPSASHSASSQPTPSSSTKTSSKPKPTPTPTPKPKPTPTPTPKPTPAPTPHSYVASVTMKYGTITVNITVAGTKITNAFGSAAVPQQDIKSQRINNKYLPKLSSEVLSGQSANINGFTGATFTSNAYKQALANALSQAGL